MNKLSPEERRLVEHHRREQLQLKEAARKEKEYWEAEQKRLDAPGLGCLFCDKTEREVILSGVWQNNYLVGGGMKLVIEQKVSRGMGGDEYSTVFQHLICAECGNKTIKKLEKKLKKRD